MVASKVYIEVAASSLVALSILIQNDLKNDLHPPQFKDVTGRLQRIRNYGEICRKVSELL
jgi:hypothetical protein